MREVARVLFVGDIHLGRRPGRLPADLGEDRIAVADLTPAAAWRKTWEYAIRARIDAVVLAGDVVESTNARFEAFGHLRRGVDALAAERIPVLAVAGNHDVEALPRLARMTPGAFRLIGEGGRWETVEVRRAGSAAVGAADETGARAGSGAPCARLLGWSFPAARVSHSPLSGLPRADLGDVPTLGVLHADLDAVQSPYAPVALAELEASWPAAWLLGHVHRPSLAGSGPRPIGYLGSLVGLDPSETGPHGPWLARIGEGGEVALEQVALAPLRWEAIEVDVSGLPDLEGLDRALVAALARRHAEIGASLGEARAVGCRLDLVGATPLHRAIRRALLSPERERLRLVLDGVLYFVHEVRDRSRPALDLARLARGSDPPALLARALLALEDGRGGQAHGDDASALLASAGERLRALSAQPTWGALEPADLGQEAIRARLARAAFLALEELTAQTDPGGDVEARR